MFPWTAIPPQQLKAITTRHVSSHSTLTPDISVTLHTLAENGGIQVVPFASRVNKYKSDDNVNHDFKRPKRI
jgi:hypothetical protein